MFKGFKSRYASLDDLELLENYQKTSDVEFLGVLYHRYMHLVYGLSLKYLKDPEESKDAVMQVFEKLTQILPNQDIKNFKSWLYVVTRNHCLWLLKKRKLRVNVEQAFMESSGLLTLNGKEDAEHEKKLGLALNSLSEPQRRCIRLFFFENQSYRQIAESTGYELKKVKSYIQNGKRNLKIYLDRHEG